MRSPFDAHVGNRNTAHARRNDRVHKPGALRPTRGSRRLGRAFVVAGPVHGLVNVRTDGRTVLCATLNDGKGDWTVKTFKARFG